MSTPLLNLMDYDRESMLGLMAALGERSFRAGQLLQWIYQQGVFDFAGMTNLSKDLRGRLGEIAEIRGPEVVGDQTAADGTRKWLLQVDDKNRIETVFIPEPGRGTLCVSSQAGCALNCSFCATGRQGYNRNLSAGEIIGQVWLADRLLRAEQGAASSPITNVVMMGMGEPLLNFDNVVSAMRIMLDDYSFGMSRRRITLSTAGVVPAITRLGNECPVSLAVSLHAPNDTLRDELVPLNRKYPIRVLLDACRRYVAGESRRRITYEYTMLAGVNDAPAQARELRDLLADTPAKVNLIPYNPVPGIAYRRSDPATIDRFRDILLAGGIMTITRKTRGADIAAACGQLTGQITDRTQRSVRLQRHAAEAN